MCNLKNKKYFHIATCLKYFYTYFDIQDLFSVFDMQTYRGQTTYHNGQFACTSISWLWGVACSSKIVQEPIVSSVQMDLIMQNGISLHEKITSKYNCRMIHSFELIETSSPSNFEIKELIIIHDRNLYEEFKSEGVFLWSNLKLKPQQSLIYTVNNHTIAFHHTMDDGSYVFDPMVASVEQIESVSEYINRVPTSTYNQSYGILLTPLTASSSC